MQIGKDLETVPSKIPLYQSAQRPERNPTTVYLLSEMQMFPGEVLPHSQQPLVTPEKMNLLHSHFQVSLQEQAPTGVGLRMMNFDKKETSEVQFYYL